MRTKTRLTITLSQEVVRQIDQLVNGAEIKNRSHAIETLIKRSLSPTVRSAIILAGGKYVGKDNPALAKFGHTTLLAYTLGLLKKHHLNRVIISLNQADQQISKIFGNGEDFGLKIEYSFEEKPLGTGGAVKKAQTLLKDAPFLVMHGDTLTTLNLTDLFKFHFEERALATIAVKPIMGEPKYGQVFIRGNKVVRFLDKGAESGISIINTGLYVFDPKIFAILPSKKSFTLEKEVFPTIAQRGQLSASLFQTIWYDISTADSYQEAKQHWQEVAE